MTQNRSALFLLLTNSTGRLVLLAFLSLTGPLQLKAEAWSVSAGLSDPSKDIVLVGTDKKAEIVIDANDYPVVTLAATMLNADVERVTGHPLEIRKTSDSLSGQIILAGTLGHNALIDQLASSGKLGNLDKLKNHWETTLCQIVENPFPGVTRAFVIVGSDRRGTAYGMMDLSQKIGVSPWYWWADVPVKKQSTLVIAVTGPETSSPSVKYRGIFINDENWGLNPWAAKTFDPDFKNIGPKTYEKVFELMLRLKLNYLWPAMHPCSTEFGSVPENSVLADKYAIVMGASHCEPLLRNNVWWPKNKGPWRYDTNHDNMFAYWEEGAKMRGDYEAVWTLGMRGIHDAPMQGPPDTKGKVALLQRAITDQRQLLSQYVSPQWGPVAQCFVPYKEVQPLYDAGLEVPPDVTLVWADDNYGYIRRLSSPEERTRPGGSGVYYHISYYGNPRSYTWINTTAPSLLWEEMHKAWENDTRTLWVVNVGDIKPMEVGIDFFSHLTWDINSFGPDAQPHFLHDFVARTFGPDHADEMVAFLDEFYRLGQIHKPECMDRDWTAQLTLDRIKQLQNDYQQLLDREKTLSDGLPQESKSAWTELIGYPAKVLGATGILFMDDRLALLGIDAKSNQAAVDEKRQFLVAETQAFNEMEGGKWRYMMPDGNIVSKPNIALWARIDWPWMDKPRKVEPAPKDDRSPGSGRKASDFSRKTDSDNARWVAIQGLGYSGKAMQVSPPSLQNKWDSPTSSGSAPGLEYDFQSKGGDSEATIYFLPTFRIYPGMKLRVAVGIDDQPSTIVEVPGSNGVEDERGPIRSKAVRDNRVALAVPLGQLSAGKHIFKIHAVDPGAVIDEIALP